MEKVRIDKGLYGFKIIDGGFSYCHGKEDVLTIMLCDIKHITIEGDMNASTGAYVNLEIETDEFDITINSESADFFDVLEYINENLDTDLEAVFSMSSANTKTKRVIFDK